MSVNSYLDHIMILPEDDQNRQLAVGFRLEVDFDKQRQIQVLEEADGWIKVFETFESEHVKEMDNCQTRFMVLLIDFDGDHNRRENAMRRYVPEHLMDRVFVLGSPIEVEDLKRDLKMSPEAIGSTMAKDCRDKTNAILQQHKDFRDNNEFELDRLREKVRAILF
jgi:hypothetical protein